MRTTEQLNQDSTCFLRKHLLGVCRMNGSGVDYDLVFVSSTRSVMKSSDDQRTKEWAQLVASPAVREQQAAFACATGLALTLLPASALTPLSNGKRDPIFCVKGCMGEHSGPVCQKVLLQAEALAARNRTSITYRCPAGLTRIFVPVMVGGQHIGSLMAGPFSLTQAREATFRRLVNKLKKKGITGQENQLGETWRQTPVLSNKRSQAVATLVNMFAGYLAECSNRLMLQRADRPSPLMQKIEAFLAEQQADSVTLTDVAKQVNLSPCHFCKVFKKQTGLTFSEYRTRQRVERAKQLILGGQHRVSEAAFEAGFNSIPYFNRAFRRYVGYPPTEFRERNLRTRQDNKTTRQA